MNIYKLFLILAILFDIISCDNNYSRRYIADSINNHGYLTNNKQLNQVIKEYIIENKIALNKKIILMEFYSENNSYIISNSICNPKLFFDQPSFYDTVGNALVVFYNFHKKNDKNILKKIDMKIEEMNIHVSNELMSYESPEWVLIKKNKEYILNK